MTGFWMTLESRVKTRFGKPASRSGDPDLASFNPVDLAALSSVIWPALEFINISRAGPRKDGLRIGSAKIHLARLRHVKRHRVLNAAARFLRTLSSQVLLQPRVGRSAYERRKHCKFPSIILSDCRGQSGRRPPGCRANQIAARRAGPVHAAAALGAEHSQPAAIAGMITFD